MHRAIAVDPDPDDVESQGVPAGLRSSGTADLAFEMRSGRTRAIRTYQAGCLRVRMPRTEHADEAPYAVLINTAGGLAEGDRLHQNVRWGEHAVATVATQAAEKVYRALAEGSHVHTRLDVERGAQAEWLPQETILFDKARLQRDAMIVLAQDVTFLGVEAIVLGRQAMGESVRSGRLRDRMRIWRNGRLIYADTLSLDGDIARLMHNAAIGNDARAMAVLVHASDRAANFLEPVRAALEGARGLAAASTWNGLLAVRMLAPDAETLRHDITAALAVLREGRPLPRVWRC
ncbi:urease accessory protein [Novosphingobium sp. Rr 2-17]|uniref:urease accessory protein UreD n=1 Tax=Novosphingobium sp. Rr 2-17 TaxID=555793 RepID=UPI000269A23D|nr:urease accessory protein UreD [Novosphingobium sp. Rr 2-17]EIZ77865.1 urease accessory protein [Novosphingobium sp. Rr 2-17]